VYESARAKLAAFKPIFDTAIARVRIMQTDATNAKVQQYSRALPVEDAEDLALAVLMIPLAPVQQLDDEPGVHFWKAIEYSKAWNAPKAFENSLKEIRLARQKHQTQRAKKIGLGLNPLTDPTEQMFLRACDELIQYWTFKQTLYDDPTGKTLASRGSTGKMLRELLDAKKATVAGTTTPTTDPPKLRRPRNSPVRSNNVRMTPSRS
jgi:hypothetical protein